MDGFFQYDPLASGSKGLIFLGNDVLVYRRDNKTTTFPLQLDLPGGGTEGQETPFETFRREVMEEFGLTINPEDIVYVRRYPSTLEKGRFAYYPVARLPASDAQKIRFGHEGTGYVLMSLDSFIARKDAWPILQKRAKDYKQSKQVGSSKV